MGREVRRVALDYKHPTEYNPNWENHYAWFRNKMGRDYRLHDKTERFIALHEYNTYAESLKEQEKERRSYIERSGHDWEFSVAYHITGFASNPDDALEVHPVAMFDGFDEEILITARDEDHLQKILIAKIEAEIDFQSLREDDFMPSFEDVPEDQLGYCLYEDVSEGTPVTPVFASKQELIDYLVEYGSENDPPYRRESAEALVNTGFSMGSFFAVEGKTYHGAQDMDKFKNM